MCHCIIALVLALDGMAIFANIIGSNIRPKPYTGVSHQIVIHGRTKKCFASYWFFLTCHEEPTALTKMNARHFLHQTQSSRNAGIEVLQIHVSYCNLSVL